jgi:hypothetical protein
MIIAALSYFLYVKYYSESVQPTVKTVAQPVENNPAAAASSTKPIKTIQFQPPAEKEINSPQQFNKDDLMRLAAAFAERFGSYSNQSNFSNITDLKIFMSQPMQSWANSYLSSQRQSQTGTVSYYGIITKAIAEEVKEFDDDTGQAAVLVKTRRREAIGTTENTTKVFNQDILITFVKEQGAWKVDKANWNAK